MTAIFQGDTSKSVCSRSSYYLLQLLQTHPSMKSIVVREIMALALRPAASSSATTLVPSSASTSATSKHIRFTDGSSSNKPHANTDKPNVNTHARYYATITFNQIVLNPADLDVARQLIDIYFDMFKEVIGEEDGDRPDDVEHVEDGRKDARKRGGKGKDRKGETKGAAGFMEVESANSRLISAILTGINRALPFAKIEAGDAGYCFHTIL
jgi:ribosome biogenesis protein MAK21